MFSFNSKGNIAECHRRKGLSSLANIRQPRGIPPRLIKFELDFSFLLYFSSYNQLQRYHNLPWGWPLTNYILWRTPTEPYIQTPRLCCQQIYSSLSNRRNPVGIPRLNAGGFPTMGPDSPIFSRQYSPLRLIHTGELEDHPPNPCDCNGRWCRKSNIPLD